MSSRKSDDELVLMGQIWRKLEPLPADQRNRIINWLNSKQWFGGGLHQMSGALNSVNNSFNSGASITQARDPRQIDIEERLKKSQAKMDALADVPPVAIGSDEIQGAAKGEDF